MPSTKPMRAEITLPVMRLISLATRLTIITKHIMITKNNISNIFPIFHVLLFRPCMPEAPVCALCL